MPADIRKLKDEAARAVEKGRWKRAAELYDELWQAQPEDTGALHRAGEAFRKLGRKEDAINRFEREAGIYAQKGFLIKAIAICKLILEIDTKHTRTQEQLAELYALQKEESGSARTQRGKTPGLVKHERTLPPGQPLEVIQLARAVPTARPVAPHVVEIPTEAPDFGNSAPVLPRPRAALPKTPLFSALGEAELRWLIEHVRLARKAAGERVFTQGDAGEALYVIAHGEVTVLHQSGSAPPIEVARLGEGAFFGEMAIVTNHPRSASVVANVPTELIEITRQVVSDLVDMSPNTLSVLLRFFRDRMCDTLLSTGGMFASFSPADRWALIERFRFLEVDADTVVIREGERANGLYIVAAGRCAVLTERGILAELGPGDLAGEMSLLTRNAANATVKTLSKCYMLQLPREVFSEVIVTHPQILEYAAGVAESRQQTPRLL